MHRHLHGHKYYSKEETCVRINIAYASTCTEKMLIKSKFSRSKEQETDDSM